VIKITNLPRRAKSTCKSKRDADAGTAAREIPKEQADMADSKTGTNGKTVVLISYNQVEGFRSGWHARKKVFVCANDAGRGYRTGNGDDDDSKAGSVLHKLSGQYRGAVPVERVKHYYIYAGLHAMDQALGMAKSLNSQSQAPVTIVACSCQSRKKEQILDGSGIPIKWCECGGESTMGGIAKVATKG